MVLGRDLFGENGNIPWDFVQVLMMKLFWVFPIEVIVV
jgi:hypothetical protein